MFLTYILYPEAKFTVVIKVFEGRETLVELEID